jgi:hypothetical protein
VVKEQPQYQPDQSQARRKKGEGTRGLSRRKAEQVQPKKEGPENQQSDLTSEEQELEEFRKALKNLGSKDEPPEGFFEKLREEVRRRYPERIPKRKGS